MSLWVRQAMSADHPFVVEMARYASIIEDWPLPEADSEDVLSLLPNANDIALIAASSDACIGAAWTFQHDPVLLDEAVPEVAIAVLPHRRNQGVGGALLDDLLLHAAHSYDAVCLNVHQRNPSRRLYERKRFRVNGAGRGALGIAMIRDLR